MIMKNKYTYEANNPKVLNETFKVTKHYQLD